MEKLCYAFKEHMNEAIETKQAEKVRSELDLPQWSVVSFDVCEAAGLTYAQAATLMIEKEAAGVYGLCILTDEAAARVKT